MLAVQSLGYGKDTIRLSGAGVTISSAVRAARIQACGLAAATSLKRDQREPMRDRCSGRDQPLAPRKAFSNRG